MIFLSFPYTHSDKEKVKLRVWMIEKLVAKMAMKEIVALSPVLYYHNIGETYELPMDYDFWAKICIHMLDKCKEIWVIKFEGWEKSVGVADEIGYAVEMDIPIKYIDSTQLKLMSE